MASDKVVPTLRVVAFHQHEENTNLKETIKKLKEEEERNVKEIHALEKVIAGYDKILERTNDTISQMYHEAHSKRILDQQRVGNAAFAWALEEKLYQVINPDMSFTQFGRMLADLYARYGEFRNLTQHIHERGPGIDIGQFFNQQ